MRIAALSLLALATCSSPVCAAAAPCSLLLRAPTPFASCTLGGVSSALRLYTPPDPWAGSRYVPADRIQK